MDTLLSRHQTTDALAMNLDLPSTFLDWAGIEIPQRYQGRNLTPLIGVEKPGDWRTETFHEHFAVRKRIPAFEGLRGQVKVSSGGNSGIQYRGTSRPEVGLDVVTGYQCDVVANTPEYNGMLYEEKGRRILSHTGEKVIVDPKGQPWVIDKFPVKEFSPDSWHEYRVLVEGNHHRHWIDGHPTADLIDLDAKGRDLEGVLAVQVHVGPAMQVQYRNFKIKHLPDNLPLHKAKDHAIPADAYGVRPQGKSCQRIGPHPCTVSASLIVAAIVDSLALTWVTFPLT